MKIWAFLIFTIILSQSTLAAYPSSVNVTVINLNLDLLLKKDGSIDVTQDMFEKYQNVNESVLLVFDTIISPDKEFTDLRIYDLIQSPVREYTRVPDVIDKISMISCDGKFSINKNDVKICTKPNDFRTLNFRIKYTLLADIPCKEVERRQQHFRYSYPVQTIPYNIEFSTRAEEGMKYDSPINCPKDPKPWKNIHIENGMKCKIEGISFSEDNNLVSFDINGSITADRLDILEQQKNSKEKIKNLIPDVVTIIIGFLAIIDYNWKEYIKNFINKSKKNKIITLVIFLLYLAGYVIFKLL